MELITHGGQEDDQLTHLAVSAIQSTERSSHRDLPNSVGGRGSLGVWQHLQLLPFAREVMETFTARAIAGMRHAKALDVVRVGQPLDESGACNHKNQPRDLVVMLLLRIGGEAKKGLIISGRATVHKIHVGPGVEAGDHILTLVHHHPMGHGVGKPEQARMLDSLLLDVSDKIGIEEEALQGSRAALGNDIEHISAIGLSVDPVHLDDDRAGNKVLSFETNPAAML